MAEEPKISDAARAAARQAAADMQNAQDRQNGAELAGFMKEFSGDSWNRGARQHNWMFAGHSQKGRDRFTGLSGTSRFNYH